MTLRIRSDGLRACRFAGVPANPNPAKVLNLSLGGYGPCSANEQAAIDSALARGAIVVVAAGNDATLASDFSPANCKGVIAVGASNLLGDLSSCSNFGNTVESALRAVTLVICREFCLLSMVASLCRRCPAMQHTWEPAWLLRMWRVSWLMLARDPGLTLGR